MASDPTRRYEEDFYAWTRDQAASLRDLARARWNGPLDLEHLAEEVEDLGRSERNAVRSQLRRLIEHLLKLRHSPAEERSTRKACEVTPCDRHVRPLAVRTY